MTSAILRVSGSVRLNGLGTRSFGPITASWSTASGQTTTVDLSTGDNTVSVPSGANGVVVVMPAVNTESVSLSRADDDASIGLRLARTGFAGAFAFDQDSLPTQIFFEASGAIAGVELQWL